MNLNLDALDLKDGQPVQITVTRVHDGYIVEINDSPTVVDIDFSDEETDRFIRSVQCVNTRMLNAQLEHYVETAKAARRAEEKKHGRLFSPFKGEPRQNNLTGEENKPHPFAQFKGVDWRYNK